MEFTTLVKDIADFNNDSSHKNIILNNSLPDTDKDIKGNQHELNQYNWTVSVYKYRKDINDAKKGIKIKKTDEIDSIDQVQDKLQKYEFSKGWSRMNTVCKKIKITEYVDDLLNKNLINKILYDEIKIKLLNRINNNLIKNKDISYDKDTFIVKHIYDIEKTYNLYL